MSKIEIPEQEKRLFKKLIDDGSYDGGHSPDLAGLQDKYWFVPVFVFGPDKRDLSMHHLLRDYPRVGIGWTHETIFVMKTHRGDPFAFCEPTNEVDRGRVQGEIYVVPPSVLAGLDREYENTSFTRRAMRWIRYFDPTEKDKEHKKLHVTRAWMYTAFAPMWQNRQNQLRVVGKFNNERWGGYYQYTPGMDTIRKAF